MHMLVHKTEVGSAIATSIPVKTLTSAISKPHSVTISRPMKTLSTMKPPVTTISRVKKPLVANSSPHVKKKVPCDFCPNTYCDSTQYYRHANRF